MPKNIVVVIREDPQKSHRAAEAVRIALGLSTGPNPVKIILLDKARVLASEDAYDLPDGEMLEKYLPVIQNLQIPILLNEDSRENVTLDEDFSIQKLSDAELTDIIGESDRVLAF